MPFKEYFTTKNVIFLILVLLILKFLSQVTVVALLFFASFVIASSLNPIVDKLEKKKMKRTTATSLVLLGTLIISIAFFLPIIFVAIKQVQGLINILPEKIDLIQNFLLTYKFYGHRIPEIVNIEGILKSSSPFATGLVNQSITFTINIAQGILFLLAICMIVFYFMADKEVIKEGFLKLFPPKMKEKSSEIYDNISNKVGGYVIAQLLNMVAIGVLTAIGLALIKVDYALLLGLITGVLDIIPLIGPTIALVLCLIMANQMGLVAMVLVLVAFLTAQWISNNLVRPVIFGRFLDLHPLIIIFALLVAAQFLGVWGVILAPAIASLICVLFDEIYLKTINKSDE
ncbi:MAG: AI-2E family transporter [Candidatus Gastranaerophilales bacterium]|nr:AI-2E family transporter [Candidatus Gastranaerophilales bacterium]